MTALRSVTACICGTVVVPTTRHPRQRYCSRPCAYRARRVVDRTCSDPHCRTPDRPYCGRGLCRTCYARDYYRRRWSVLLERAS